VVTFEEIIAGWVSEGTVPAWPGETPRPAPPDADAEPAPPVAPAPPAATPPVPPPPPRVSQVAEPAAAEEHFIPPDPPPMPRIGVTASIGLALLGFGIVLLALPGLLGHNSDLGLPLGLVSLALGLGWLVLRSWPAVSDDDDSDDGAVL